MHLDAYQEAAFSLNRFESLPPGFPHAAFCALGLGGELGEAITAPKDKQVEELGDVLWYLAVLAHVLDFRMSDINSQPVVTNWAGTAARLGAIQELLKKLYRNNEELDAVWKHRLRGALTEFFGAFRGMCRVLGTTVDDVMDANLEKMRARELEGTLLGNREVQ